MYDDVPSPIDLRLPCDARAWAETAMSKRPHRTTFFERLAIDIAALHREDARILELGSGPGFLASHVLATLPSVRYVALDFSSAMHAMARDRLDARIERVSFLERDFLDPAWSSGLGRFDAVVTMQAVHELRHKRRATELHRAVRSLLVPFGSYFVCDHFVGEGGMANERLFMRVDEQRDALERAGFERVEKVLELGGLVLHRAW
jgi:SAM-dependent methyltransferase